MRACSLIAIVLALLAFNGCKREEVKIYQVSKAQNETSPANEQPQLQFIPPQNWQQVAPGQMRVASFIVTNANGQMADVGVIPLPTGESDLALINMWRDQMQLPALTNETAAETISIGNEPAKLFDIASEKPLIEEKFRARILVAELARGDTSWFFKMTGEDSFVASQKENFLQFLKSVSFGENSLAQIANATENQNPIWTIPSDWQQLSPSEFLIAKFLIQTGNAKAEVNVSQLDGEGGGLLANVNRWRGQLGLNPFNEMELAHINPTIDLPEGGHLTAVDFSGTDSKTGKPARLIGAVVPRHGKTCFYKLMGDESIVARQKDAFLKFIQSAKYPDAR